MNHNLTHIEEEQGQATMIAQKEENGKKVYIESYGCQMNFNDSEIVASILSDSGYNTTSTIEEADLIFVNTCSIREKAEQTVKNRIKSFTKYKKRNPSMLIGVLGCMAERLKTKLLEEEKLVDLIAGPDAYRDLPNLINEVEDGRKAVNVILSKEETYADISPIRLSSNGVTAFISIMRGCDNMCTFCVVPFTRGRERSRSPESIVREAQDLVDKGYKEVTLLGQNVDSYLWYGGGLKKEINNLSEEEKKESVTFAQLLEKVAQVSPDLRVRFSTSHPKDITDDVLYMMAKYRNICKHIHLPVQSGSSQILEKMNRGYTKEWYLSKISRIREIVPECSISTDIMTGFCTETDKDQAETIDVMNKVQYEFAYMFKYSERPNTKAERKFEDDVPEKVKGDRLTEIINMQHKHALIRNKAALGKTFEVLAEAISKRSNDRLSGRSSQNKVVIFPKGNYKPGDYVNVKIDDCTSATLLGKTV